MMKRFIVITLLGFLFSLKSFSQEAYIPYNYHFYQQADSLVYSKRTRIHSALKPDLIRDTLVSSYIDSLLNSNNDTLRSSLLVRKLFQEHLIDIKKGDYSIYADFLPDFQIGRADGKSTWLNTRGYQLGGKVGKRFYFYTSGYENQGQFADYYQSYINRNGVVPGQSYDRKPAELTKDWSYATALVTYIPSSFLSITLGQDKNFIGDGYRSMLLSDYSSNYPFLKLTANLGNIQYMAMWASFQEPRAPKFSYDAGNRKKGGVFHYLDWNVSKRLSLGLFDAVIWTQYDDDGNRRGFDWGYANPIIFLRPVEAMSGSPDNAALGLNAKYELFDRSAVYGQFFLDEFEAKNFFSRSGSYRNKWGAQIGIRGADLFKVSRLNYLAEFNTARPYTYTSRGTGTNDFSILTYGNYSEPLAHPYGANFREAIGILSYGVNRLNFRFQLNLARYGLDSNDGMNYGKNIYRPYNTVYTKQNGNFIGQGNSTTLNYMDVRVSYLFNPKYNLRIELGGVSRREKQMDKTNNTNWITFGLRSSFRNLYQDF